jgi:hypothetical protein
LISSSINGPSREFTWYEANTACKALAGQLAKIEGVQTNEFVNSALGGGAYSVQWIGAKCVKGEDEQYRYRWSKDNLLVAAGYTVSTMSMRRRSTLATTRQWTTRQAVAIGV